MEFRFRDVSMAARGCKGPSTVRKSDLKLQIECNPTTTYRSFHFTGSKKNKNEEYSKKMFCKNNNFPRLKIILKSNSPRNQLFFDKLFN